MVIQPQRINNLVRMPFEPDEQKIGIPYNPASRTSKPETGKISQNLSNASILEMSSQLLESSKDGNGR